MITIHESSDPAAEKIRVTFTMPAADDRCDALYLVGWFDEWDEAVYRMQRSPDGTWTLTLELEPGCEYLYAYRTPAGRWLNDPAVPVTGTTALDFKNSFVLSAPAAPAPRSTHTRRPLPA